VSVNIKPFHSFVFGLSSHLRQFRQYIEERILDKADVLLKLAGVLLLIAILALWFSYSSINVPDSP